MTAKKGTNQEKAIVPDDPKKKLSLPEPIRKMALQYKYMIVNGNRLSDQEAISLALYSKSTGLNPYAGECWYIPGVGPGPGIAGWRKKAQEQLAWEGQQTNSPIGYFWTEDEQLSESGVGAIFDPEAGDIAYKVTLKVSTSSQQWRKDYFEAVKFLRDMGSENPLIEGKTLVGEEPSWTGIGIVYGSEKFAFGDKPEKFNRHERAIKRAEKIAIRKRFPRIDLPLDLEFEENSIDAEWNEEGRSPRNAREIIRELGFDTGIIEEEESQEEGIQEEETGEDPQESPQIDPERLNQIKGMTTPKGAKLGDLSADQLMMISENPVYSPEIREGADTLIGEMQKESQE